MRGRSIGEPSVKAQGVVLAGAPVKNGGMYRSRITGTGAFAPPRVVTNADMAKIVDTNDEWIRTRTGIQERRLIDHEGHMATSEMAEPAARQALEQAGVSPAD